VVQIIFLLCHCRRGKGRNFALRKGFANQTQLGKRKNQQESEKKKGDPSNLSKKVKKEKKKNWFYRRNLLKLGYFKQPQQIKGQGESLRKSENGLFGLA